MKGWMPGWGMDGVKSNHRRGRRRPRITNGARSLSRSRFGPHACTAAGDPSIAIEPGGKIKPDREGISRGSGAFPRRAAYH